MNAIEPSSELYRRMQESGMNDWVGGGPVAGIAEENFRTIRDNTFLRPDAAVLDFGCGIGRTAVPLADHLRDGSLVGIDMVPRMIDFCRRTIMPACPNTRFHLLEAEHAHYDGYKDGTDAALDVARLTEAMLRRSFDGRFDLVVAFSVFTHLAPDQTAYYLRLFHALTARSGLLLLTAHLDAPWNAPLRRLRPEDDGYRDCLPDRPLQIALYDPRRLAEIAEAAGWRVWRMNFGVRDVAVPALLHPAQHGQDVLVLSKIPVLAPDFDAAAYLRANPRLRLSEAEATAHYRGSGYFEGRPEK